MYQGNYSVINPDILIDVDLKVIWHYITLNASSKSFPSTAGDIAREDDPVARLEQNSF